jgi:predicted alpha-1,2-mannosidase
MYALVMALAIATVDPVVLVNPFVGTSGTQAGGPIDTFPGADVPFGMLQWSPDTPSQNAGGGYEYGDHEITGFSLTHLSGPGCNVFGDFAFLPTLGAITNPAGAKEPFSHANERATPGSYDVTLNNGVQIALTTTQRTGLGSFTFPSTAQANLLINASSDQAGVTDASVRIVGDDEVSGLATSGAFCGMPDVFTVYFAALFDRPFASHGTWRGARTSLGSSASDGAGSGAWVSFDATRARVVRAKVAISYVSVAGALANLHAENRGWDLGALHAAAVQQWRSVLGRVAISGGSAAEQTTFYTALYHAFLHPNVYSDDDGRYRGFDGNVHHVRAGHVEYANYSDWDVYRSQIPLVALLDPDRASDMMQSLVDAATQGGVLPRWALVNGPTSVMGGDSIDPVIAGAYAFGARDFDAHGALAAMVRGASQVNLPREDGWYVERPELREYLARGYIANTHTTSVSPVPNGASETLEYALDDFSIARLANALGDARTDRRFMQRSSNWANLFDTATGLVAPRDAEGAFMQTPITDSGQSGFQEGNAAQYTWMVPQDLRDLVAAMGGTAAAQDRLDTFFTQLDAGQNEPYAWLGNEPSLGSPWVYLSAGAPWRTQALVRQALLSLYGNSPTGLPGNDDLGEMSAWYVWSAIGLYPQNPAVRALDVGSPLFTHVAISSPHGPTITIDAPNAADNAPYVQSLAIDGHATQNPWFALPMHGTLSLAFSLGRTPNEQWGSAPANAPPSYAIAPLHFPVSSAVTVTVNSPVVAVVPGAAASVASFTISNTAGTRTETVRWIAPLPPGLSTNGHTSGIGDQDVLLTNQSIRYMAPLTADVGMVPHYYDIRIDAVTNAGARLQHGDIVVRIGDPNARIPLAFIENIYDNSVSPIDLATGTLLPKIPVGSSPRDAVFGRDGLLYVADRDGAQVSVIDPNALKVVKTIRVGQGPSGIASAPDGTIWFANNYDGTVQSIDPRSGVASAPIAVGPSPRSIAILGSTLYVTVSSENEVVPIDLRTRVAGTPIAVGRAPTGIAATPDGTRLYVVDHGSNDVTPIDVASGRALSPIPVGVGPLSIAIVPGGRMAYVTNEAVDSVTPIDLVTNAARPAIATGGEPYGIVVTSDGAIAWVVNREDNDLVPIDLATGHIGAPISDPYGPLTLAGPR